MKTLFGATRASLAASVLVFAVLSPLPNPALAQAQAQGTPQSPQGAGVNTTACTSGFTAPDPSKVDVLYLTYMRKALDNRMNRCQAALTAVKSYLPSVDKDSANDCRPGLFPRPPRIPTVVPPSGSKDRPAYDADLTELQNYDESIATLLDHFCAPLLAQAQGYLNAPSSILYKAVDRPTVYVLLSSAGAAPPGPQGSASGSSANSSAGGKQNSGAGGGGGAGPSASTDVPDALLLYLIASDLQNFVCGTSVDAPQPIHHFGAQGSATSTYQTYRSSGCAEMPIAFVPESQWTFEDFRTQCVGDPTDSNGKSGTVAGIILNGAVTSRDGAFHIVDVGGGTEANFNAEVVSCQRAGQEGVARSAWSDLITSENSTFRISLFPLAVYATWVATLATAHNTYNVTPATPPPPGVVPGPLPPSYYENLTQYQKTNTALLVTSALAQFAASLSTMVIGNPSSGLTLRQTFKNFADTFTNDLVQACDNGSDVHNANYFCDTLTTQGRETPVFMGGPKLPLKPVPMPSSKPRGAP